ncbi:hypothetical protein [Streptacidiphilus cavernicola]|uniref:Integral membrane protein n=1 Tax=Streptacidiphilus cavernicola TaxID=3342716 RepID=A0ABV6VXB0_9ACTN
MGGTVLLRVARAAVFAGVSLSLSAGGQLLATGAPLPVATALWAGLAVFLLALLLAAEGERGYARIAALLVPLELVLNAAFNIGQASCGPGVPPGRALNGLPTLLLCGGGDLHGPTASPVGPGLLHLSLPNALSAWQFALLLAVHLLAALLAALWLRRGEAAVFRTLRTVTVLAAVALAPLRAVLLALLVPVARTPGISAPPAPRRSRPGPQDVLLRTARRRGPPLLPGMR